MPNCRGPDRPHRNRDSAAVTARIDDLVTQQRVPPFDLGVPPLIRFVLVRDGDSATLIVTNHHTILDGWSGPLVLADMLVPLRHR